jgi:hypothetical protein
MLVNTLYHFWICYVVAFAVEALVFVQDISNDMVMLILCILIIITGLIIIAVQLYTTLQSGRKTEDVKNDAVDHPGWNCQEEELFPDHEHFEQTVLLDSGFGSPAALSSPTASSAGDSSKNNYSANQSFYASSSQPVVDIPNKNRWKHLIEEGEVLNQRILNNEPKERIRQRHLITGLRPDYTCSPMTKVLYQSMQPRQ